MTIGQVTISAADWLASRVSDRMALVVAGQKSALTQQTGSTAIEPGEENAGAQLDRRQRERSILAAQESYKRVAQRIKSRLANPIPPTSPSDQTRSSSERTAILEGLERSPKLAATLIAAEQAEKTGPANSSPIRLDALFGIAEPEQKKAEDRQAASVEERENAAAIGAEREAEEAREPRDTTPVFQKGLWDDLFVANDLPLGTNTLPRSET